MFFLLPLYAFAGGGSGGLACTGQLGCFECLDCFEMHLVSGYQHDDHVFCVQLPNAMQVPVAAGATKPADSKDLERADEGEDDKGEDLGTQESRGVCCLAVAPTTIPNLIPRVFRSLWCPPRATRRLTAGARRLRRCVALDVCALYHICF